MYKNAEWCDFRFDLSKTASASDDANMSFADYISAKQATLKSALEKGESDGNEDSTERQWEPYIRGDFTNWQNDEAYKMTECEGGYTITLTRDGDFKFKVYDNKSGAWFGAEVVTEDTAVEFTADGHTNVCLPAGSYTVIFSTRDGSITLLAEE